MPFGELRRKYILQAFPYGYVHTWAVERQRGETFPAWEGLENIRIWPKPDTLQKALKDIQWRAHNEEGVANYFYDDERVWLKKRWGA